MTDITGANLIAGRRSSRGTSTFRWVDPISGEPGDVDFHEATSEEVEMAAEAALDAFQELRDWGDDRVAALLRAIADELEGLEDRWLEMASVETGLDPDTRLAGERTRTTGQLRFFADIVEQGSYREAIIDPAQPDAEPIPRPDLRRLLRPLGPVAVFGASNFPLAFAVAGGDTASALAARCPVVYKAHPSHPGTDELAGLAVQEAVRRTGAPSGTFSLMQGVAPEVGAALVQSSEIRAVGFTGSLHAGRALYDLAADRPEPIPVYAEMGSVNPVFVTGGALRARAGEIASGFVESMMLGTGQWCTKPGLVIVPEDEQGEVFLEKAAERLRTLQAGPMLNQRIKGSFSEQLERTARLDGVETVVAGGAVDGEGFLFGPSLLTVDVESFLKHEELLEEHFGPASIVVRCPQKRMSELAERLESSLTGTIHAEPDEYHEVRPLQAVLLEKAGRFIWNGFPTGVAVTYAMHHGGPYPATTSPLHTSVGGTAIRRFLRPVSYQDTPQDLLPEALRDENPLGISRLVGGELTDAPVGEA